MGGEVGKGSETRVNKCGGQPGSYDPEGAVLASRAEASVPLPKDESRGAEQGVSSQGWEVAEVFGLQVQSSLLPRGETRCPWYLVLTFSPGHALPSLHYLTSDLDSFPRDVHPSVVIPAAESPWSGGSGNAGDVGPKGQALG